MNKALNAVRVWTLLWYKRLYLHLSLTEYKIFKCQDTNLDNYVFFCDFQKRISPKQIMPNILKFTNNLHFKLNLYTRPQDIARKAFIVKIIPLKCNFRVLCEPEVQIHTTLGKKHCFWWYFLISRFDFDHSKSGLK